jgi:hypothetical protein
MVAPNSNPSTQETEAGGPQVEGSLGYIERPYKKKKRRRRRKKEKEKKAFFPPLVFLF